MTLTTTFVQAAWNAQATRYCCVAAAVIVFYDWLLTFHYEVDFFWKRRWSIGKVVFFFSRYYGIALLIFNAWGFTYRQPTKDFCEWFFQIQSPGAMVQVLVTHLILEMRLYAMYMRSRLLMGFFIWITCVETVITLYLFEHDAQIRTNQPFPGVFICADADPPWTHIDAWWSTQTLIVEAVFLCLACYQAYFYFSRGFGGIVYLLRRDSIAYFLVIFTVYLTNTLVWFHNDITINETVIPFFFAFSFICANRLMINIRIKYWQHENTHTGFSVNMPQFGTPVVRVAPTKSELKYGARLQPGDLESIISAETGEAGPSNYQERASSTEETAAEDHTTYPPPSIESETDDEAAEEKVKGKAEENRNWLASASVDPTVPLDEIDARAEDVYRSTFQESFGF